MRTPAVAFALTLAALAVPAGAEAATRLTEHTKITGESAVATWDYIQGTTGTFVSVVVTNNNYSDLNGKGEDAFLSLAISQYDTNTGNVSITGVAYTSTFDLTVAHDLGSATLHVHDAIFQDDNTFTFFNVDLDLTWTATADAVTQTSRFHERLPGMVLNANFKGEFRDAVCNGSVYGKDVHNTPGNNIQFTPVPSSSAQLQHNQFGSVSITTGKP
jgi:hypothetical protein